jgi:peptidoglycan/LPS O-acetylase OafA/YrhL
MPLITPGRENAIGLLRHLLALLVIWSHSYGLLFGPGAYEPLVDLSRGAIGGGQLAVDCFFVLSGLVITQAWLRRPDPRHFLTQRARRLYPALIVCCLVSIAVISLPLPHQRLYTADWYGYVALSMLATLAIPPLPNLWPHNPERFMLNGSTWTLGYEAGCYLALVALGVAGSLRRRRLVLALFGVALGVSALTAAGLAPFLGSWPRFAACFLAGVAAYLWRDRVPASPWLATLTALLLLLCSRSAPLLALTLPTAGAYLLLLAAYRLPAWRVRADYSYGLYLYAWPVQQLLVSYLKPSLTPLSLFLLASLLAFGCAWLSWHRVERRWLERAQSMPRQLHTYESTVA